MSVEYKQDPNCDVVLEVKDLEVTFDTDSGVVQVLHGVSFKVKKGKTLGPSWRIWLR